MLMKYSDFAKIVIYVKSFQAKEKPFIEVIRIHIWKKKEFWFVNDCFILILTFNFNLIFVKTL